ncbi:MAG TPA: hemerythrin domain-containing protein [Thermoleophilia bacterium]|nr:hemerythrin domain-containing protein [Thermoleophilia bacterium]
MRPTEILSREHALVMLVTKVAEQEVRYMHDTGEYRPDEVHQVVDFFEFFTEACHDPKEEHILFARLAERGLDPEVGILGQLYREHAEFTSRLHDIEHWLRRDRKEGPLDVAELADMLETYLHLMRAHVMREDELLFTLANGLLTPDDQEDLLRAFAAVDAAEADEGVQERYNELAHLLMSRPTETLRKEHKVCSTMLGAMAREISRVEHGDVFEGEDFQLLVDFFEYYMEECHEPKEAQLLFTKMTDRGVSDEGGLVAEMVGEHAELGARLQAAEQHLPKAREGDIKARAEFFADLKAYIDGMQRHMKVEDDVLFPMIEHVLTQRELEELARAFESMESQAIADGVHDKYVDLARRLSIP